MMRVLLVDDQRLVREGLRVLLEMAPDVEAVLEAEDGAQALELYAQHRPDVVLMDIRMPGMDGVEATRRLLEMDPQARVLILTTFDDDVYVLEGLRAGARGYLLKDASREDLMTALRTVAAGGALFAPRVAEAALDLLARSASPAAGPVEPPTEREQEILRLMAQGLNNKAIAERLHLAHGTVKNYVSRVLAKLGVENRAEAVAWFLRQRRGDV